MAHKILASVVLGLALGVAVSGQPQPRAFFKDQARLSDGEIQKIEQGHVVTKVLGSTDKYGMLVFGAVYINAPIKKFAASFRDVKKLKENKVYLEVQEFSPAAPRPRCLTSSAWCWIRRISTSSIRASPANATFRYLTTSELFRRRLTGMAAISMFRPTRSFDNGSWTG